MSVASQKRSGIKTHAVQFWDFLILFVLVLMALTIVIPFINVIATSFASQKEFLDTPLLLIPKAPTTKAYSALFADGRIAIGYRSTLTLVAMAVPLNIFLTASLAYALSRGNFPGRKALMVMIVCTMLFQGGIIPLYLIVQSYGLTNSMWSVVLTSGVNTFYMILMMNYFQSIPISLIESARLDGASEWRILFRIVVPLSLPIFATVGLYYLSDRWNEWYHPMIFINSPDKTVLQLVLRSIVNDTQRIEDFVSEGGELPFSQGVKMAAVVMTMLPAMCIFPFLQKYFVKGVKVGAVKE
ncbi:carbohydrate ABC transporter permease [Eubacteriales bacterium OttesenSCG-928-A19]|nr:carbohydrate ABC transporter permease [Eubacteriales bacterium OttesenSCG-928-A19]